MLQISYIFLIHLLLGEKAAAKDQESPINDDKAPNDHEEKENAEAEAEAELDAETLVGTASPGISSSATSALTAAAAAALATVGMATTRIEPTSLPVYFVS